MALTADSNVLKRVIMSGERKSGTNRPCVFWKSFTLPLIFYYPGHTHVITPVPLREKQFWLVQVWDCQISVSGKLYIMRLSFTVDVRQCNRSVTATHGNDFSSLPSCCGKSHVTVTADAHAMQVTNVTLALCHFLCYITLKKRDSS
jgi:hypothetical protein